MAGARPGVPGAAEAELLLLQSQALAEEEAAKTRRELLSRFLQEKLSREQQISAGGLHKLRTLWRSALREAKGQELRADIETLSQSFSRALDCKDGVIEALLRELEEADEQQNRALRSHLSLTDQLLELQRCRLRYLEEGFAAQVDALKAEFEAERRIILKQQEWESWCLEDVAWATEQDNARIEHEATLDFQSARDDIKSKSWQEQQYSRLQLVGRLEGLWKQIQKARQSYNEATEHKMVEFKELLRKCERSSQEIEAQSQKLQKLQDTVAATRAQIAAHARENEEQIQRAREGKEEALQRLQELRQEVNRAMAAARADLTTLSCQSGAALKVLLRVVEKAQRLLRLAEMCRRLETEEEKVLPFYPSSLTERELRDARRVLEETPVEPLAQAMQDYVGLERFWQRFNKAKLEEKVLEQTRAALAKRNQHLRELLQQYLAGVTVSRKVFKDLEPLLATKSHVPRNEPRAGAGLRLGTSGHSVP